MKFGHDALEVGRVHRKFPGSLFQHCEFPFGGSLAVRFIIGSVKNVSGFLDGVEVYSVIDDVGVDHSVGIAFEEGRDVHHLVSVIAELLGAAYQLSL